MMPVHLPTTPGAHIDISTKENVGSDFLSISFNAGGKFNTLGKRFLPDGPRRLSVQDSFSGSETDRHVINRL